MITTANLLYELGRYAEALETADNGLDIFAKLGLPPESLNVANARRDRASVRRACETRAGQRQSPCGTA